MNNTDATYDDRRKEFQKYFLENGGQKAVDVIREVRQDPKLGSEELAEIRAKLEIVARNLSILEL